MLPRHLDDVLPAWPLRVQLGVQDYLTILWGAGKQLAVAIHNLAQADEAEAALLANAVDRGVVHMVLQGPGPDQVASSAPRAGRPVGRQHYEVGTKQHEHPRRLGKAPVVTDIHADAQ